MAAPALQIHDQAHAPHTPSATLARLLAHVPDPVRSGFTSDQLAALDGALADEPQHRPPVNIRFTLFGRVFLVILAGREARHRRRRTAERSRHPLRTVANILFLVWVAVMGLTLGSVLQWLIFGA